MALFDQSVAWVDDLGALRLSRVKVSKVPIRRMKTLARYGLVTVPMAIAPLSEKTRMSHTLPASRFSLDTCNLRRGMALILQR